MGKGESQDRQTKSGDDAKETDTVSGGAEKDCCSAACALGKSKSGKNCLSHTKGLCVPGLGREIGHLALQQTARTFEFAQSR